MAIKATIFKINLQISDMDRHYYQSHDLTIARHPSETDARMMVRVVAFALNACEQLTFTKGLSADEEPDLWEVALTGDIDHWIDLGQPEVKRIRKACGRGKQVSIFCYQSRSAKQWWLQNEAELRRLSNLSVIHIAEDTVEALAQLVVRNMDLQITIQDADVWLTSGEVNVQILPEYWMKSDIESQGWANHS